MNTPFAPVTRHRHPRRLRPVVAVIAIAAVSLAACSDSGNDPDQGPAPVETMRFPDGSILQNSLDTSSSAGS